MTLGSAPKSASTVELDSKKSTQLRIENEIDASLESVPPHRLVDIVAETGIYADKTAEGHCRWFQKRSRRGTSLEELSACCR